MSSNISKEQLEAILKTAGRKLGVAPDALRAAMSDPQKAESLLSQLDERSGGKISANVDALEKKVKGDPKAKKMLDDLARGGKNG